MSTASKTKVEGVACSVYLVKDTARAIKFWTDFFGSPPTMEYGPAGEYGAEWTFDDDTTFGLYKPTDQEWRVGGGVMFTIADIKAAVAEHKARGVKFDDEIVDSPVCLMAFGDDSEGNHFILHEAKTAH